MSHLTTSASYFKKLLRKHLSVLLSNYIYFNLKYTFTRTVNDAIMPGIYSMFTVLSQNELRVVNDSLDYGGKHSIKLCIMITKIMGNGKINKRKYICFFCRCRCCLYKYLFASLCSILPIFFLLMCQLD